MTRQRRATTAKVRHAKEKAFSSLEAFKKEYFENAFCDCLETEERRSEGTGLASEFLTRVSRELGNTRG